MLHGHCFSNYRELLESYHSASAEENGNGREEFISLEG